MIKEQRERMPEFLANIQEIIDRNGMIALTELLKVTAPTVKKWIKGKSNGGTEPPSAEFSHHEKLVNDYMSGLRAAGETQVLSEDRVEAESDHEAGTPVDTPEGVTESAVADDSESAERLEQVELQKILPNPYQPRKVFGQEEIEELAASMKSEGLIQPIVVRTTPEGIVLVAGERRMRAALTLGWMTIKAVVTTMSEAQAAAASIIENFQRVQNNPIEIADAIAAMIERTGVTQKEVAKMIGVTQPKVAQIVSLTKLTAPIREQIIAGTISQSVGRVAAGLPDFMQEKLLDRLVSMSTEKVQHFVNIYKGLAEIGERPEEPEEDVLVRLYKRLYQASYIDIFRSTNETLNAGAATVNPNKLKGFYINFYDFDNGREFQNHLNRLNIKTGYYNGDKLPVLTVRHAEKKAATELAISFLKELRVEAEVVVGETEGQKELSEEDRKTVVLESFENLKQKVELQLKLTAGSPFEHSFHDLETLYAGLDDEDWAFIETNYIEWGDRFNAIMKSLNDTDRVQSMNRLQESLKLVEETAAKVGDSEELEGIKEEIMDALTSHFEKEDYYLSAESSDLWRQASSAAESVRSSQLESNPEASDDEEPTGGGVLPSLHDELPILNRKPEKTKTNRILQILQEEADTLHEISVRCKECQFFNPNGDTYRNRCMSSGLSFHHFKRLSVDGTVAFNCSDYTPRQAVIEEKKATAAMDHMLALFELQLYGNGYSKEYPSYTWAKNEIPELRNSPCTPEDLLERFAALDNQARSYWIEVFFRRKQLSNVVAMNKPHPFRTASGKRYMVSSHSMENDDMI